MTGMSGSAHGTTLLRFAICGLLVAVMTALCLSRSAARNDAPDGWSRQTRGQAFVSQAVLAAGPQSWNVWSLAAYQRFIADGPADQVTVELSLPESGRIELTPQYKARESRSALVIEAGSSPKGMRSLPNGESESLSCTGSTSPIDAGRMTFTVRQSEAGWTATIGEQELRCATTDEAGQPALTSGLRRVKIHSISADSTTVSGPGGATILLGLGTGFGLFILLFGVSRWSSGIATAIGYATASGWLLLPFDGARLTEILRLIDVNDDHLPLTFAMALATAAGAIGTSIRWARDERRIIAALPTVGLFLGLAAVWPVIGVMGWLYAGIGGLALGGLVWVNVHAERIRHYNLIALVLAGAILGSTEVMVRFSHVGSLWSTADTHHGAGSMGTLIAQFEGLESGVHSTYPGSGFPVQLPPKHAATRIACMGASSTGGAFQNDSLDDFYPARLAEIQPVGTEVVNQGVAGWTSFHIRKFLDRHVDTLNAEIWTLYLGVNENMATRMSFADLYDAWQAGSMTQRFTALDNVRLFQGLRLLARGLQPGAGAGVPPADFRNNIEHIVQLARQRGVKVLLMSEGVRPDPSSLWRYAEVMSDVAQTGEDVHYLDTAAVLDTVGGPAFLDSNHLTDTGHRAVANTLNAELLRLGWW